MATHAACILGSGTPDRGVRMCAGFSDAFFVSNGWLQSCFMGHAVRGHLVCLPLECSTHGIAHMRLVHGRRGRCGLVAFAVGGQHGVCRTRIMLAAVLWFASSRGHRVARLGVAQAVLHCTRLGMGYGVYAAAGRSMVACGTHVGRTRRPGVCTGAGV